MRLPTLVALGTALAACSGGGRPAPTFGYGTEPLLWRVGEPAEVTPTAATGAAFTVEPTLPAGLQLDPINGRIHGTPATSAPGATYTVRGMLGDFEVAAEVRIAIGPALPTSVAQLDAGFAIEHVASLALPSAKMALLPDGRVLVGEIATGVIRVVAADGSVAPTPFATVPVTNGSHRGLLGIAVSPSFGTDRFVFAMATTPPGSGKPERSIVYRWTESGAVGTDQVELRDDLPVSTLNNGGALCFDATGMLLVSVGDTEDPELAQSDASLAGKILRIDPADGSAPADNPMPGSPVYAKGLRNTFAIAVHPEVGTVFAADNGPADNDELLLLLPGRNYEWGAPPGAGFGALAGPLLRLWPDVVVPTGLAWRDPADDLDWPESYERSLYLSFYDEETVDRFEMSGPQRADIDRENRFLRFVRNGIANKPLDLQRGPDGRLWILTFTALYRVDRIR